ncbi:MAG: signal peptide peptidase SppA [Candidatus Rokuibacteriota bacterium]
MARRAAVVGASLLVYLVVTVLFVGILRSWTRPAGEGFAFGPRVAVVELDGIIVDTSDLVRDLQQHRANPLVRAVVIRINSPGGVVAPTQELHTALVRIREAGKPVVASLGAVAASGGYYVAVAADRIYANPGTVTGSIGVIMQMANLENLFKKVGVDWVVVKSGQFKDLGNVARPMTPEERRLLQAVLDDVHAQFVVAIADGRKLDRAEVVTMADGRIFSGAQAKANRMVDELGGLEDALNGAASLAGLPSPPRVLLSRRRFSISEFFRNQLGIPGLAILRPELPAFKTPLYLMD